MQTILRELNTISQGIRGLNVAKKFLPMTRNNFTFCDSEKHTFPASSYILNIHTHVCSIVCHFCFYVPIVEIQSMLKDPSAFRDYLVKNLSMQVDIADSLLASSFSLAKVRDRILYRQKRFLQIERN